MLTADGPASSRALSRKLNAISDKEVIMREIIIPDHPASSFLCSVCLGLTEKHASYRIEEMAVGDLRGEINRRRHPFGRIPILQQLSPLRDASDPSLRCCGDAKTSPAARRSQGDRGHEPDYGHYGWYLFLMVARVIMFQRVIGPLLLSITSDEAAIAAAVPAARRCLGELSRLLGRRGDRPQSNVGSC
jgi:glutathione S-transferase